MRDPGPLGAVPQCVLHRGVDSGLLDQAADRGGEDLLVVELCRSHDGLGHFADLGSCCRHGRLNDHAAERCRCLVHLGGQLRGRFAVGCRDGVGEVDQAVHGLAVLRDAVILQPVQDLRARFVVDLPEGVDVALPAPLADLHQIASSSRIARPLARCSCALIRRMSAWSKPIISRKVSVEAKPWRALAILIAASAVTATLGMAGFLK